MRCRSPSCELLISGHDNDVGIFLRLLQQEPSQVSGSAESDVMPAALMPWKIAFELS
jgi:hypothetical protein